MGQTGLSLRGPFRDRKSGLGRSGGGSQASPRLGSRNAVSASAVGTRFRDFSSSGGLSLRASRSRAKGTSLYSRSLLPRDPWYAKYPTYFRTVRTERASSTPEQSSSLSDW